MKPAESGTGGREPGGLPITVELVAAQPGASTVLRLPLPQGACVIDALQAGAVQLGIEDPADCAGRVGIFGSLCKLDRVLRDGDRVELYRSLALDAKSARRLRAGRAAEKRRGPGG